MDLVALASDPLFWKSLVEIIIVNIILSGDNAVVIALAARHLPHRQQKAAVFWGSAAAIVLRVILTLFAVKLLQFPYLKLVGAGLLIWIGAKLLLPEEEEGEGVTGEGKGLFGAIRTILIADLVMSLDNVIAVAAAAETGPVHGRVALLIIVGSQLLLKLMERWPIIITLGAALLGFVAGEMAVTDPAIEEWFHSNFGHLDYVVSAFFAILVVVIGMTWAKKLKEKEHKGAHGHG